MNVNMPEGPQNLYGSPSYDENEQIEVLKEMGIIPDKIDLANYCYEKGTKEYVRFLIIGNRMYESAIVWSEKETMDFIKDVKDKSPICKIQEELIKNWICLWKILDI